MSRLNESPKSLPRVLTLSIIVLGLAVVVGRYHSTSLMTIPGLVSLSNRRLASISSHISHLSSSFRSPSPSASFMSTSTSTSTSSQPDLNAAGLQQLREYWFEDLPTSRDADPAAPQSLMEKWYYGAQKVDDHCRSNFLRMVEQADQKSVDDLKALARDPKDAVAIIVLLDQMPRNLYRDKEAWKAYKKFDPKALQLAKFFCDVKQYDRRDLWSSWYWQGFLYMPFMHSEDLSVHDYAQTKIKKALEEAESESEKKAIQQHLDFQNNHSEVLRKFGRYPSRNACLERESSKEEEKHLEEGPGW